MGGPRPRLIARIFSAPAGTFVLNFPSAVCGLMHIKDRETLRAKGQLPDFARDRWPNTERLVRPTEPALTVLNDGRHELTETRWGLVPSWARDPAIGGRLFNARAETVAEKPAFRESFKKRRCLVLASGFVEWRTVPGRKKKEPMLFELRAGAPLCLAGLWAEWRAPSGEVLRTCTVLTTTPNELVRPMHDRMPVILPASQADEWLEANPPEGWDRPFASDAMRCGPILLNREVPDDGQGLLPI